MMQSEYDFCNQYVAEFLAILNYPIDDYTIDLIEKYREEAIYEIEKQFKNTSHYNLIIEETNNDYDKQLFDYIKTKVADIDNQFFNERINSIRKILVNNNDYAIRLGMNVNATKIDDFYENYLIALERTLRAEINPTLK